MLQRLSSFALIASSDDDDKREVITDSWFLCLSLFIQDVHKNSMDRRDSKIEP